MASKTTYIDLSNAEGLHQNIKLLLTRHFGGVELYCCARSLPDDIFEKFYEEKLSLSFLLSLTADGILCRHNDYLYMPHALIVQCALIRIQSQQPLSSWLAKNDLPFAVFCQYFYQHKVYNDVTKLLIEQRLYHNAPVAIVQSTSSYKPSVLHIYKDRTAKITSAHKRIAALRRQFIMTLNLPVLETEILKWYSSKAAFQRAQGVSSQGYWKFFTMKQYCRKIMYYLCLHNLITLDAAAPEVREPLQQYVNRVRQHSPQLSRTDPLPPLPPRVPLPCGRPRAPDSKDPKLNRHRQKNREYSRARYYSPRTPQELPAPMESKYDTQGPW